jgi:L-threonylcarbamoyladenylate synthase
MNKNRITIVTPENGLEEAVALLRNGQLVAFPTETVYGLGANALDAEAVARIFLAKGRPATNPVIVHVASITQAKSLVKYWTPLAQALAEKYWPGPLTLVLEKAGSVPDIVTAGGNTVGIRIPAHPVALALLERAGVPVAAPSANRSEEISPTLAAHVAESLAGYVDDLLILDGGACTVGIESTVVDATGESPRVLRPGMVVLESRVMELEGPIKTGGIARSPGQMSRHYAPKKPVRLVERADTTLEAGWVVFIPTDDTPTECANRLYATLRAWDADKKVVGILLCLPPNTPEWEAIRDRLKRAAASA